MPKVQKRSSTSSHNNSIRESSPPSYRLGARSCRACHQRKVRCDREVPCTNCSRYGITCVYPTKETDLARRGPTLQSISTRLERLEVLLSRLAENIQVTTGSIAGGGAGESQTQVQFQSGANVNAIPSTRGPSKSTWELLLNDEQVGRDPTNSNIDLPLRDKSTKAHHTPPAQQDASAPSDMGSDVLEFYPDTQLALCLWHVYLKSVDPVLKILHIPTVQSTVVATILDPKFAHSSTVALTYAIYFAAVTALCHDNNHEPINLPCEKPALLKRYKIALDRLLTVTDLMGRPDVVALQALAIYVTCLRVHEFDRSVWILNGLAIRLAQSIGLHRDGASLQLSPFESEMRLRLWWHLCVLDSRAPEDQGFQPAVDIMNRGLRLPLNVNDNQLYPEMTRLPAESNHWTEMSFFLIQTESCRLLHPVLDTQGQDPADALLNVTEKRRVMDERGKYMKAKYGILIGSETATDLSRIASQHVITGSKKMEFVLQLREEISMRKQNKTQDDGTPDVLKLSFKLACDGLQNSYVLLNEGLKEPHASGFKWFFKMYVQWYALSYVLRCLCTNPCGPETERAWTLVEELFPRGMSLSGHSEEIHGEYGRGSVWKSLNRLRYQALSLRKQAQLSVATTDVGSQSYNSGDELLPDAEIPAPSTAIPHGTSTLPELGEEFIDESNQSIFSSLDMSIPGFPFLPDWNAIINGSLDYEIDSSYFPGDAAQF